MKERMVVRRNVIDIEAAEKDLQVKLYRKVQWQILLLLIKIKCYSKAPKNVTTFN